MIEEIYKRQAVIRKISFGQNYKDMFHWFVGQVIDGTKDNPIISIYKIEEYYYDDAFLNRKTYNILCKHLPTNKLFYWKSFEDVPCIIEYDYSEIIANTQASSISI